MTISAVRLTATKSFVGIFSHDSLSELRSLVDQFCAPSDCDFAALPNGGIAAAPGAPTLPLDQGTSLPRPVFSDLMPGLVLNWSLEEALFDRDLSWSDLDPFFEHEGSRLDALMETPEGRQYLAQALGNPVSISTEPALSAIAAE